MVRYIGSDGREHDIATMPERYMRNAVAVLKSRGDPARAEEIEAMEAEIAKREGERDRQIGDVT